MGGRVGMEMRKCKAEKKTWKNEESFFWRVIFIWECEYYFKGGRTLWQMYKIVTPWAYLVLRVYKIFSFLLLFTYHHGLYFTMIKKTAVRHSNSTRYHFLSCRSVPTYTKLNRFEIFLAFLQTRWSGSWGISDTEKFKWVDYISSFACKGAWSKKYTLIK